MAEKNREDLLGKVIRLKDIVAYQEGTIASRMVVVSKAGSITVFSFDAGEEISEHTAPYDAVVTILEGMCEVTLHDTHYQMQEGETIIFPAHAPHAVRALTRCKMMLTMIRD
ncbi:MAG TPA: cupin domain-containing protein [Methanospirillum sp.]|uniref:cupin domain-containing protein n=1 Tax=Methanospirillum sp. TaxID=45200 RepID=UPI002BCF6E9D|nr:cupin domain-containing protein [Methanospirillum sp.]HOJ96644.1 cupin domain-containing protein [Methanospirillum sp.]HOL40681.1 cupin domain-containing protein [Methanospirillum sp.]HPP79179.1 cupin domain-containing protein [Methanospirillum sp.]